MSLADEFEVAADGVVRWRAPPLAEAPVAGGAAEQPLTPVPAAGDAVPPAGDERAAAAPVEAGETDEVGADGALEPAELPPAVDPQQPMTVGQFAAWEAEAREAGRAQGLEQGRRDGFAEGFEKGLAEGRAEGRSESRRAAARLDALHELLRAPLDGLARELESELLSLAVAMAQQLVRREIQADPAEIQPVIAEALAMLPGAARGVSVYLHPDDAALVRTALDDAAEHADWQLREDPLLSRGGCRVESADSIVDASLETRLAALMAAQLGGAAR